MIRIIPAIDIIDGKCVRLSEGDFNRKKIYNSNPVEVAKSFEDAGLQYLHLVDLDGAVQGKPVNLKVLEKIAASTDLKIDCGGGIKTDEDVKSVFDAGAAQITAGSIAVSNPLRVASWLSEYGAEKILLGADVKGELIAVNAWKISSNRKIYGFLEEYLQRGIEYCICTDIAKDGLLVGPSFDLYSDILEKFPKLKLIASGGVSSLQDLMKLQESGCFAVIIGKALYEQKITLNQLKKFCYAY
jgi:phosphoribosylformimino-5-aminoimidazole carboxamide ribotide isomerase